MAIQPYIVVRLVPDSPVDGATFATYLDGLQLQVIDANTGAPRSDFAYSSPLILTEWPGIGGYFSVVSAPTSGTTTYHKAQSNYGQQLSFQSTDGISVGSYVFSSDMTTIEPSTNLQVTQVTAAVTSSSGTVTPGTVEFNGPFSNYVPAGTVVTFLGESPSADPGTASADSFSLPTNSAASTLDGGPVTVEDPMLVLHFADTTGITVGMTVTGSPTVAVNTTVAGVSPTSATVSQALAGSPASVTFTLEPPFSFFSLAPVSGSPTANPTTLKFSSGHTNGIAVGMTIKPIPGLVSPGTVVTSVTLTTVTLSLALLASLPAGQSLTFTFPLSSGIVQDTDTLAIKIPFLNLDQAITSAAAATAIIPLNLSPPLPLYLDIKINAIRGSEIIPVNSTFYNVLVSTAELPAPDQYQAIVPSDTSLYLSLPPQPGTQPIPLAIPSDGSPPAFDALCHATETALTNDPITGATLDTLISSPADCTRIAYDIVWSYQNSLPLPPDPLDSLYTNPPNPGGSGGDGSANNLEQDRVKFEGTLNGFYSSRNATAERLTKFVAAASAAVACENASLNSSTALLEFPVDPTSPFATAVESELVVRGLGENGSSGLDFGVPAAFFYALGANLDKTTTAAQRFQMATGDAIERLLHEFTAAEGSGVIDDSESFVQQGLTTISVTAFQAARRLAALGISAASNSPTVPVYSGTLLAQLIGHWLTQTDPTPTPPPNPVLPYQNTDFNIWTTKLESSDPQGYLYLDLDALTQGYVIPYVTARISTAVASGSTTLTFEGSGVGMGPGMPVSGTNIAPGTTVAQAVVIRTVTLSAPLSVGGVTTAETITFGSGTSAITASPTVNIPAGNTLTLVGTSEASGINAGMSVSGTGIAPGTTVIASVTTTTVTLSAPILGNLTTVDVITFNAPVSPVQPATTVDCPTGGNTLTSKKRLPPLTASRAMMVLRNNRQQKRKSP